MPTLKKQTISGIKWTFVASIVQKIISLSATAILARILSPADFGLFGLAFVLIDALGIFKSFGFDTALIRRKDDIDKASNTAFLLIPPIGIFLYLILLIVAPLGARFLGNPSLTNVARVLGFIFVISCFGKVAQNVLYRDMKFKYKSTADIIAQFIYSFTAVILALNKFGIWSLVIAYILKNLVQISIEWYFSGWKPKFEFDKKIAWEMFHFGKYLMGSSIIGFLYSNLDNIVIGKLLGVTMLGYYFIAMNLSNFLNDYFFAKVGMIMYPAYSKIQDDMYDVKRVMAKMVSYISTLIFPFCFGVFIFAPDILRLIFGEKWLPASPILRILLFAGMFRALGTAIWPIFLARGKSKADFQVSLVQILVFLSLVVPLGFKFKLIGVGIAVLISAIISFFVGLIRAKLIANIRIIELAQSIKPAFLCSILMSLVAILLKSAFLFYNIKFGVFIALGGTILTYLISAYLINKNILIDLKKALIE